MLKVMHCTDRSRSLPRRCRAETLAVTLMAVVALAGCEHLAESARQYRLQHDIPPGSHLVLQQDLPVVPGRRDVYIQYGRVQPFGIVNQYDVYCELVLRHLSEQRRQVPAGRYEIQSAGPYLDRHGVSQGTVWYAGIGIGGDPAPSPQLYTTRMRLQGPPGSDVQEMICGALYDPMDARYPTIDEIQAALGGTARLELAAY